MLVIVEDRNVEFFAKAGLNDEAFRGRYVLKVDATKCRADIANRRDELFDFFRGHFHVDGVNVSKTLKQNRLTFHHRLGSHRAKIAQTKDSRTVRNYGDHIAFGSVIICEVFILCDRQNRHRNTRRIRKRKIALCGHRFRRDDGQFPWHRILVKR